MSIALTLLCAFAAGWLLDRARVPGGMMIGAVIGACALGALTNRAVMPGAAKTAAQIIAGAFIGAGVTREEMRAMKTVARPALIVLPCLLLINIAAGLLIRRANPDISLITAFMCCTPGGVSDIPMIAADLGADTSKVVVMQFVRFIMGIALFPLLIRLLCGGAAKAAPHKRARDKGTGVSAALTLAAACACGLVGKASPLPSGTMALATLGSVAFKYFYPRAYVPQGVRKVAQCLSGAYVGASIGARQLAELPGLALPAAILVGCYLLGAAGISALLRRAGCFDRTESLLAATPAGASDMALISADLGVSNVKLILLQILRLIVVVSVFPALLSFVARALS